ncbi:hypothetical protein UF29_21745, partial [Vibrio parahaemolyticus]
MFNPVYTKGNDEVSHAAGRQTYTNQQTNARGRTALFFKPQRPKWQVNVIRKKTYAKDLGNPAIRTRFQLFYYPKTGTPSLAPWI